MSRALALVLLALTCGAARASDTAFTAPTTEQEIWQIELLRLPAASLHGLLQDPSPEVRARAARAVGRLRERGTAVLLGPLLSDPDADVRREAAFALGLIEGSADLLARAWHAETDASVRDALANALGRQGGPEAVDILVAALDGRNGRAAAEGLGRLGTRKVEAARADGVVAQLLDVVSDPVRFDARRRAAWALGRMGLTRTSDDNLLRMRDLLRIEGDGRVRAWLLRAWSPLAAEIARAEILRLTCEDADATVRIATARALARGPFPGAEEVLARLLRDTDLSVRLEAVTVAASIVKGPTLTRLLAPALNASEVVERAAALRALVGADASPLRPETFLDASFPLRLRVAAAESLKDRAHLLDLALHAPEPALRSAAAGTLLDGEPTFEEMKAILLGADLELAQAAADALEERPDPAGERPLLELLARPDLPDTTAESAIHALVAVYGTGKVRRPGAEAAARVRPYLTRPRLAEDAKRLSALLKIDPPTPQHPSRKLPPLEDALAIRSARILTSEGEIRVQLLPEEAPYTVWNFAQLAEAGSFDGIAFHRVVADFVIQTGDPRGDGWGGPGYDIPDELNPVPYETGTLGMALSGPDTGGSQWFITLSPQPHLDAAYTVFGRVVSGMRAAQAIQVGARVERVVIERVSR